MSSSRKFSRKLSFIVLYTCPFSNKKQASKYVFILPFRKFKTQISFVLWTKPHILSNDTDFEGLSMKKIKPIFHYNVIVWKIMHKMSRLHILNAGLCLSFENTEASNSEFV